MSASFGSDHLPTSNSRSAAWLAAGRTRSERPTVTFEDGEHPSLIGDGEFAWLGMAIILAAAGSTFASILWLVHIVTA